MAKKSREEDFDPRIKSSGKDRGFMRVKIRHISTPDADWRLRRAIDILLRAAETELEGNDSDKEEEPVND